jgi:hypothetical protein
MYKANSKSSTSFPNFFAAAKSFSAGWKPSATLNSSSSRDILHLIGAEELTGSILTDAILY